MQRYDRYILTQLVVLFGFFSLVLVSVYWVNTAVDLFDALISDGQNLVVFLEFTALSLPRTMLLVLPVSAFVATLYIFNRMIGESELVVFQTAGMSAARLLRPVFLFGLLLSGLILILANVLAPAAQARLNDRQAEVREDVTARLLRAGQFIHPADGLTVYIREITELGEFLDLFMQDRSEPGAETTYVAQEALLVREATGPRLVMFDGAAQTLDLETGRLSVVSFADFTFDIGALLGDGAFRGLTVREIPTPLLIAADAEIAAGLGLPLAHMLHEGHDRIAKALFAIFPPLIAAATLLMAGFSRLGIWRQILVAVLLVVPLQVIWNASEAAARRDADLFYVAYAQPAASAVLTLGLIVLAMRKRRSLRRVGARPPPGGAPA